MKNLCLAGGVALNCVGNGRILREGPFENIWIQPAAGDAGGALGDGADDLASTAGQTPHRHGRRRATGFAAGPRFSDDEIRAFLDGQGARYHYLANEDELYGRVADLVAAEKVVGWVQGRMEFGPRALGGRSILGDARSRQMQAVMNLKIKFRESFRPFAPVVLQERSDEFFDLPAGRESPYMLLVAPVAARQRLPVDGSRRSGLEKLKIARELAAGGHARRLLGASSDRGRRAESSAAQAAEGLRGQDGLPGDDQHQFQCPRGTDRLPAGGCLSLFSGHEHGRFGVGAVSVAEGGAEQRPPVLDQRAPGALCAGLM